MGFPGEGRWGREPPGLAVWSPPGAVALGLVPRCPARGDSGRGLWPAGYRQGRGLALEGSLAGPRCFRSAPGWLEGQSLSSTGF